MPARPVRPRGLSFSRDSIHAREAARLAASRTAPAAAAAGACTARKAARTATPLTTAAAIAAVTALAAGAAPVTALFRLALAMAAATTRLAVMRIPATRIATPAALAVTRLMGSTRT